MFVLPIFGDAQRPALAAGGVLEFHLPGQSTQ
jgi:hypothetical protein